MFGAAIPLLLALVLAVDEVGDRLLELSHQRDRLRGVLALLVRVRARARARARDKIRVRVRVS